MQRILSILFLIGSFTLWSCLKEDGPSESMSHSGGIELKFDSGDAITLQTKASNLEEGLEFKNVLVVLVNSAGNVVDKKYKEEDPSVSQDVISFTGLLPGNYHVYAYANIDAETWQKTGDERIVSQEKNLSAGTPFSTYFDRELASLTGKTVPADPSTSMLLTGHKEIPVGLTVVTETLDLLRPVVRFKVTIHNNTRFPLTVNELRFSQFNPDRAYLLDHSDASGVPSVPSDVTYRPMPDFDTAAGDENSVGANSEETIYQRLIYENAFPDNYKIFCKLTLDRSSVPMSSLELSLGDRPFGVIDYDILNGMSDGESVDVLVTNPQIKARSGRIFAYISSNKYMAWESAGYDNFNAYFSRAKSIYDEENPYTYTGYTYSATNGYSAWDGVSADPKTDNSFDYSADGGARAKYYHSLSKSDGRYTIDGLAVNSKTTGKVSGTSISNVRIEKGKAVANKNPSDTEGKLVRFISSSNKYLQANCNWVENEPKKESNLMWVNAGTNQDRQFMLFGKYVAGGALKRILKDNNKEVPLTYMKRNEEINVVINVYYSDQEGTITFRVDNGQWNTALTSTHLFK